MTFRLPADLAREVRQLPNQTKFVEDALRDALGVTCPTCGGKGRVTPMGPQLTNFRDAGLPRLERDAALQLKELVRLGRALAATELRLEAVDGGYAFVLKRDDLPLFVGELEGARTTFFPH